MAEPREQVAPDRAAEQADRQPFSAAFGDVGDLRAAGDGARDRQRQAAQDEHRGERDDERRQARTDGEIAVGATDQDRDSESEQRRRPDRQTELGDAEADDDAGEADHRADRQVNSPPIISVDTATVRMPELGRHLQEIDDAARHREQAAVAGPDAKDRKHQNGAAEGPELWPAEQP